MMRIFLLTFLLLSTGGFSEAKTASFTVLHTNDVHGWIMARPDYKDKSRMIGGAAALANVVAKERALGPVLLLDGGDWFQGTPEGTIPRGRPVAEIFNALRYDAVVIGNHEYDYGESVVRDLASGIEATILGANVRLVGQKRGPEYRTDALLREVGGVSVGVFGLVTSDMKNVQFAKNIAGLEFVSEVETAKRMVKNLRDLGADVVIALTHVGVEDARRPSLISDHTIAREVPGIDLIVGGHSHTRLEKPARVGDTLIVQAGAYLRRVGRVRIEFDTDTKRIVKAEGGLVTLWIDEVGEDGSVAGIVKKYKDEVDKQLSAVLGRSERRLTRHRTDMFPMGAWVTDCMRNWSKTDLAVANATGIRSDLPKGDVRLRHIFEIMPFDNYMATLYMKGASILKLIERGVGGAPGILQISGGRYTYDLSLPVGRRVKKAWIRGERLKKSKVYSVTASDFVVQGGDGYAAFAEGTDTALTETLVRDVLVWCAKTYSPILPPKHSHRAVKH